MSRPQTMSTGGIIEDIITKNEDLREIWSNARGWAPPEAAQLLSRSRLDWQVSLSFTLRLWVVEADEDSEAGHLILAWANLGSLVEGTMKMFLSVYYNDYKADMDAISRSGDVQDPDVLVLEKLRQFFRKKCITDDSWDEWLLHVQHRRNAIHAFKDRDIGTHAEFLQSLRRYREFIRDLCGRLPVP